MLVAVTSLPLAGCNTTGTSTHSTDGTVTSSLGVDGNGNRIDANAPTAPWSNQVSLKGDQSARLVELGKESFRDANFGLSEKYFRQAVEIRSDNVSAWVGLAASYDQLGRFDNADRAYDQLARLKGDDPRILNNRGYSYLLRGDYKKA
ncbi:MAG: tetratricopeptide repeat protein, partial [Nitratireductor sp.]|nr:tetratricopeptide repeat protein [Nitratireductor sp.]